MQQAYGYFLKYADLLDEGELLRLFDIVKSEASSLYSTGIQGDSR